MRYTEQPDTTKKLVFEIILLLCNHLLTIENTNNLLFWCRFLNKLEPWHIVYILKQKQNTLTNFLG